MSDRLRAIYERVTTWQRRTFPNQTAASILAHMRLELKEIEAAPHDIEERADMAILAMALVDRSGRGFSVPPFGLCWGSSTNHIALEVIRGRLDACDRGVLIDLPVFICECSLGTHLSEADFLAAISAKMDKNEARRWPSPAEQILGDPVEHIRGEDAVTAMLAADARDEAPSEVEILRARVAELEVQLEKERTCAREYEQMALSAGRTHRVQMDAIAELLKPGIGPDVPAGLIVDGVGRMAAERDRLRVECDHFISEVNTLRNREGGR